MDKKDFYYRQRVLEDELDAPFTGAEAAIWNLAKETGLGRDDSQPAVFGGIMSGFTLAYQSGLDVSITTGVGYDEAGQRVYTDQSYSVTCSNVGAVAVGGGGTATGSSAAPTEGYERWVGIYVAFDRDPGDERYDGYNTKVYFDQPESFYFWLSAGTEKTIGNLLDADRPARLTGKLLIGDVRIKQQSSVVSYVASDQTRKELFLNITATNPIHGADPKSISQGLIREWLQDLLEMYNDHIAGLDDRHLSEDIDHTPSNLWADGTGGTYGSSTTVEEALEGIIFDLAKDSDVTGAARVGAKAVGGAVATPDYLSPASLIDGDVEEQLATLLTAANGRVFRGGDQGISGTLAPNTTGVDLGTTSKRWDIFLQNLDISGGVTGHWNPTTDASQTLGTNSLRWGPAYVYSLDVESNATVGANLLVNGDAEFEADTTAKNLALDTRTSDYHLVNLAKAVPYIQTTSTCTFSIDANGVAKWYMIRDSYDFCYLNFYLDDFPSGATITGIAIDAECVLQAATGGFVQIRRITWDPGSPPAWGGNQLYSVSGTQAMPNVTGTRATVVYPCDQLNTDLNTFVVSPTSGSPKGDAITMRFEPASPDGQLRIFAIMFELTYTQSGQWYRAL